MPISSVAHRLRVLWGKIAGAISIRVQRLHPQQLVIWIFVAVAVQHSVVWAWEEPRPLAWRSLIPPVAFVAYALSLLLREPWRGRTMLILGSVVIPSFDVMMPELRERGSGLFVTLCLVIGAFAYAYGRRWGLLSLALCAGVCWAVADGLRDHQAPELLLVVLPLVLMMSTSGWAVGSVMGRRRAAEAELARLIERRTKERLGLARELHDSVARDLTIIAMQSAVLRTTDRPDEQEYAREAIETTARSGLDALKRLLLVLRADNAIDAPTLVRDIQSENLADACAEAARHLAMLGFQVTASPVPPDLPNAAETTAVRVIREGTTNITKHAPPGVICHLETVTHGDELLVRVVNRTGERGPSTTALPSSGLGLESLGERLRLLGGSLTVSEDDGRWSLEARIPLTPPLAGAIDTSADSPTVQKGAAARP